MEVHPLVSYSDELRKLVKDAFDKIPGNLVVADLACGSGWAGNMAIEYGAQFVDYLDIRLEWFRNSNVNHLQYSNYKLHQCNIEDEAVLLEKIINTDVILYFGHLYHSINPTAILNTICKSKAKYIVLESKIHDISTPDLNEIKILRHFEDSTPYFNVWSESNATIKVSQPTFAFTKKFLEDAGWTIVDFCVNLVDIPMPDHMTDKSKSKQMQQFAFYAVR
jgi:hypothetical protein